MKKIVFLTFLFFLSCANDKKAIVVQYRSSSGMELLTSALFDSIEVIAFHGEGMPLFGTDVNVAVKNNRYYIADRQLGKILLFDITGKYLNSVGEMGRGPNEYLALSDMIIEENGDISVYSCPEGVLRTFDSQGALLESVTFPHRSGHFNRVHGTYYHYYGDGSGLPYQLYITNNLNQPIDSCLTSSMVLNMDDAPFSIFDNVLLLCTYYDGEVYRFKDGKMDRAYSFDFGPYKVPIEYFQFGDMFEAFDYIVPKTIAVKHRFFENQKYAILHASVGNIEQKWNRFIYGLLEKTTMVWDWYYLKNDDFMFQLKYMDDSNIYFLTYPELIKMEGGIDTEDDVVIMLKCTLK